VACGLLLPSCSKKPRGTIAYIRDDDASALQPIQLQSIQIDTAKRATHLIVSPKFATSEAQQVALRGYINQRVNALILSPKPGTGWPQALAEAKAAHIPVVVINQPLASDVTEDLYATLITTDFTEQGRRAAQWLADHTPPDKELNILELEAPADTARRGRKHGFNSEIAKHPNLHLAASQPTSADRDQAKQITARHLTTTDHVPITAIFAHTAASALGAADAIQSAGKSPGHDILILSIEAPRPVLEALLDKKLNCVIDSNPWIGPEALDAINAVDKGYPLLKHLTMKDALFDQANITKEILADRKY